MDNFRKTILSKKREIENFISEIIKDTKFYKELKDILFSWAIQEGVIYTITGGYKIGKSRTIRQILTEMGIVYDLFEGLRIERYDDILNIERDFIVFDDCFISKRVENYLFYLTNKGKNILIIANSKEEFKNLRKLMGRWSSYLAHMDREDLHYIKDKISEKFGVNLNKYVILNLKDIVTATLKELLNIKHLYTTIEEVIRFVRQDLDRKSMLREIIRLLRDKGLEPDTETIVEIGVKFLGYSEGTIRKNIYRYVMW